MNVKIAFLNGFLKEQVFMKEPLGFMIGEYDKLVCRLNKSLYGLKQSPEHGTNALTQNLED